MLNEFLRIFLKQFREHLIEIIFPHVYKVLLK